MTAQYLILISTSARI